MSGITSLYRPFDDELGRRAVKPPKVAVIRVEYDENGPYPVIPVADITPDTTIVWAAYGSDLESFDVHFLNESDAVASGAKIDPTCRQLSEPPLESGLNSSEVSAVSLQFPGLSDTAESVLYYQLHRIDSGPDQQIQGYQTSNRELAQAYAIVIRPPGSN